MTNTQCEHYHRLDLNIFRVAAQLYNIIFVTIGYMAIQNEWPLLF